MASRLALAQMSIQMQRLYGKVNASALLVTSGTRQLAVATPAHYQAALRVAASALEQGFGEEALVPASH